MFLKRGFLLKNILMICVSQAVIPTAFAQDDTAEESEEVSQEANEPVEEITVTKQNSCALFFKNAGSLKVNQKVMLKHSTSQTAVAVIRKVSPNGIAAGVLAKKMCAKNYVGAVAKVMTPDGSSSSEQMSSAAGRVLPKDVVANSSAHERIRHKTSVRVGYGLMFIPGFTVAGSYNLNHELTLEGTVDSASLNFLNLYKYDRLRFGALAHYFTTNSFHLSGGLVFEQFSSGNIGGTIDANGVSFTDKAFTADIGQLQIQIGLGNRWNVGRFVIGSEWVGYSRPLANLSENYKRIDSYSDKDFENAKTANKDFAGSASFRILNSYIGFSF